MWTNPDNLDFGNSVSLEWSDELGLSAAQYMKELQGCSIWQPNLQNDIDMHDYLYQNGVEFESHLRLVLYPERFIWSDPQEAVFDWLMSDMYYGFKIWNALFDGWNT